METKQQIPVGRPLDLATEVVALERSGGQACLLAGCPGPPRRIDGYNVGAPVIDDGEPLHGGEMHPDGDEVLMVISGRIRVQLELPDGEQTVLLVPGQATVVPKGIWHQIFVDQPGQLVHVTPGPGGAWRPREAAG